MIFAMRQLLENCIEQNMPLFSVFIYLTKAFDTVNREALWTVLERIGFPPKFISMIRLFHNGMTGKVLSNRNVTEAFAISNGVKQGCVLAPVLFNIFFTCMLSHAVRDQEKGVYICYRLDGSLFDLRRLAAKTKNLQSPPRSPLCRRLCTGGPHRIRPAADAGPLLKRFQALWPDSQFQRDESAPPTCIKHPPPPAPNIVNDDTPLGNVDHFVYLGSTISCDGSLDKEIATRIRRQARRWADSATECSSNTTSGY